MNPFPFLAKRLRNSTCKRNNIMTRFLFDIRNPFQIESRIFSKCSDILFLNDTYFPPGFTRKNFNFQPCFIFIFLSPDDTHFLTRVSIDHVQNLFLGIFNLYDMPFLVMIMRRVRPAMCDRATLSRLCAISCLRRAVPLLFGATFLFIVRWHPKMMFQFLPIPHLCTLYDPFSASS